MNRDLLRQAAASRRNENEVVPTRRNAVWGCTHCLRDFQTELGFMNHRCRERERIEELKTPMGQSAYASYAEWMRLQKRSVPSQETFIHSKQYNYFIKFAEWIKKISIPNPNQFIRLMVESKTQPVLWCRDTTFALYLQWYDNAYSPEQQFADTYEYLHALAVKHEVSIDKIYETLGPDELTQLIRRRKISPWLLVVSTNFLKYIQTLPALEKQILSEVINFGAYVDKLRKFPVLAREFRSACEAENV